MKKSNKAIEEMEHRLSKARLVEPSAELRARIVGAARETWEKAPADIPWQVPLRHLGLSAAAAILIVSGANYVSNAMVGPWQAGRPSATRMAVAETEDAPEIPYSPFVQHLIATCNAPAQDASALLDYLQRARERLKGAEPDDAPEGSGPQNRESRLLPAGSKIAMYS